MIDNILEYVQFVKSDCEKAKPVIIGGIPRVSINYDEYKHLISVFENVTSEYVKLANIIECARVVLSEEAEIEVNSNEG